MNMESLNPDWFIQGLVDFEYKKYLLLGYLNDVRKSFNQTKLYPTFSDLVFHYRNLHTFKENKDKMNSSFPQMLTGIDMDKAKLDYEAMVNDGDLMKEIEMIIEFAIPRLKNQLEEGKEIFEFIDENIEIDPIGILPLYKNEGYLLMQGGSKPEIRAYDYRVSIIESQDEKYRSIRTSFVCTFDWGITNTFESMKMELIRTHTALPNPATFVVASTMEFPEVETFLPVAKRKFIRYLGQL